MKIDLQQLLINATFMEALRRTGIPQRIVDFIVKVIGFIITPLILAYLLIAYKKGWLSEQTERAMTLTLLFAVVIIAAVAHIKTVEKQKKISQ